MLQSYHWKMPWWLSPSWNLMSPIYHLVVGSAVGREPKLAKTRQNSPKPAKTRVGRQKLDTAQISVENYPIKKWDKIALQCCNDYSTWVPIRMLRVIFLACNSGYPAAEGKFLIRKKKIREKILHDRYLFFPYLFFPWTVQVKVSRNSNHAQINQR